MKSKKKRESNIGINIFLGIFFVISFSFVILMAIRLHNENKFSKGFEEVQGRFVDYSVYHKSGTKNKVTYKIIYMYNVEGKDYYVETNYGVGVIPEIGSEETVKYNPNNPNEAIIAGGGNNLILIGIILCIGSLMFYIFNYIENNRYNSKKWNIIRLLNAIVGIFFCLIAVTIFYIMYNSVSTNSIGLLLKKINIFILVPLIFFFVGIMVIIRSFFPTIKYPISGTVSPKLIYTADKIRNSKTLPVMSYLISLIIIPIVIMPVILIFISADRTTKIAMLPFLVIAAIVILVLIRKTISGIKELRKNKQS